jgi:hypothetical protein
VPSRREGVLRAAFTDLPRAWGRQQDRGFVPEYEVDTEIALKFRRGDPTIREIFDTYRVADHKSRVIDLLARVVRVSVETLRIIDVSKAGPR